MAKSTSPTKVIIPCRLSYAHVWEPDDNGKYSAALIIDKNEKLLTKIEKAIEAAKIAGKSKLANAKGAIPKNIKTPLRDAEEEEIEDEAYAGKMWLNASTRQRPGIVNRKVEEIVDRSEVYSGCYCNVAVNFYAFCVDGNKGIAAGLNNIQKVKDGERLSGGSSAADDFEELEDEYDDDLDF